MGIGVEPGPSPPDRSHRLGWNIVVALGVTTVFGLVQASQMALAMANFGFPVAWAPALINGLTESWLWCPLVPLIFWLCRCYPLGRKRRGFHLAIYLGCAPLAAITYCAMLAAVQQWVLPERVQAFRFMHPPRPRPEPGRENRAGEAVPPQPRREPSGRAGEAPRGDADRGAGPRLPAPGSPPFGDRLQFLLTTRWHLHLLTYAVIVGTWHWLEQQRRLRDRERQARELSRQLAEARLQALRMQLNPHFLFNTLNAIATLLHRDPHAADEMIACLSDFLRMTLGGATTPESPLRTELEFARRYLDIEKVRFGERLTVTEDIEAQCLEAAVPTLVLQPLLENALRHGIERSETPGKVELRAQRDGDRLIVRVSDSGPGLPEGPASRVGVGLGNTHARLRELYGDSASLSLVNRPGGGLDVELRLPWRNGIATLETSAACPSA